MAKREKKLKVRWENAFICQYKKILQQVLYWTGRGY